MVGEAMCVDTVTPMNTPFADATAVRRTTAERDLVRFEAEVRPGWDIGGNANGGYLLAIAGRAMSAAVGRPPLSLTAHYLRPAPAGPCAVAVSVSRVGRRLATATAQLAMDGGAVMQLVGTFGEQRSDGPTWERAAPAAMPPYEECQPRVANPSGIRPELMERLAVRVRPGDDGFAVGRPTGDPEIRGWFALAAEEPLDVFALLLAADSFPPPIFNLELPPGWVPTLELTVHIRGVPAPGPLRCAFRSRFVGGGLVDEEGEIWDTAGTLVAQSRQLALTPRA
jgi:acyl-coenzyme A thioesterase PaaI-like protein